MLISITAVNFSLTGNLLFDADESSDIMTSNRRVTRTATLDGGAVLSDMGWSHADRTFKISSKARMAESDVAVLRSLHRNSSLVNCAIPEGVFQGVISSMYDESGSVQITFLAKEKISVDG